MELFGKQALGNGGGRGFVFSWGTRTMSWLGLELKLWSLCVCCTGKGGNE